GGVGNSDCCCAKACVETQAASTQAISMLATGKWASIRLRQGATGRSFRKRVIRGVVRAALVGFSDQIAANSSLCPRRSRRHPAECAAPGLRPWNEPQVTAGPDAELS